MLLAPAKRICLFRTHQQMAVLGMAVIILGRRPLKNPEYPCLSLIMAAATRRPLADRIDASFAVPRVWSKVLMTSRGVVRPAAKPPARPPATQCVKGSYWRGGFMTFESDSYAINWRAVKGTVMHSVVG